MPAALAVFLLLCGVCRPALADEDTAPPTWGLEEEQRYSHSRGSSFFDDAVISGGAYYFQRARDRYSLEEGKYRRNLDHATVQGNIAFTSGFLGGVLGFDFGGFTSADAHNSGAVDHEMSFVPWNDPWHPDWSATRTRDGASVYRAHLKLKAGPVWGKAGYFQPSGPGVLGVNWSIMPGTYQGAELGADFGRLSLAAAWADRYKAPWYLEMNRFRENDGRTRVSWLMSMGARYALENGLTLELAYGASENYLKNAHFKSGYIRDLGQGKLSLGYHLYAMTDSDDSRTSPNNNFDGPASQHYLYARYALDPWSFSLEGTYTRAPFDGPEQQGYFAYRLTAPNGSSKGAYEAWWDARTDWNAHNEKALFFKAERALDDWLPVKGFSAALGSGMGWDGKAYATSTLLKEWAFTFDLGYVKPDGLLKGAFVKLHYTIYRNGTDLPSWTYKNVFQSEHDFKLFIGIPFELSFKEKGRSAL